MSRAKIDRDHVGMVLNDKIAEAVDALCKEYGIEMIEWYYPFDDDATAAFEDLCKATTEAIEQTMSWYEE